MTETRIMKFRETRKLSARNKKHIHNLKEHSSLLKTHTNSSRVDNSFPLPTPQHYLQLLLPPDAKTHSEQQKLQIKSRKALCQSTSRASGVSTTHPNPLFLSQRRHTIERILSLVSKQIIPMRRTYELGNESHFTFIRTFLRKKTKTQILNVSALKSLP